MSFSIDANSSSNIKFSGSHSFIQYTMNSGNNALNFNSVGMSNLTLITEDRIIANLTGSNNKYVTLHFKNGAREKYLTETRKDFSQTTISHNEEGKFLFIESMKISDTEYLLIDEKLRVFKSTRDKWFTKIEPLKHRKRLNKNIRKKHICTKWLSYADGLLYCTNCDEVILY